MAYRIALLGDSIFDNAAYVGDEPDVIGHLEDLLPANWTATLLAIDGSTCNDLPEQLKEISQDVTHLVISVGGNDALSNTDVLNLAVSSTREALLILGERSRQFERDYRAAMNLVLGLRRDTTCCTIYNGNLGPLEDPVARVALMAFNDVIIRIALEHNVRLLDLRSICTEPSDYANPIEPSGKGGLKIARAIVARLGVND